MTREEFINERGLEICEFDDECDTCDNPTSGSWVRINCSDVMEADYYICGGCIDSAAESAETWCEPC